MAEIAVAPFMGAWIETRIEDKISKHFLSLPSWERGLKQFSLSQTDQMVNVAPFMGAWIETIHCRHHLHCGTSLPSWERGLKLEDIQKEISDKSRSLHGSVD